MAMQNDVIRGIGKEREIDPALLVRDHRTVKEKFSDKMTDPNGFAMIMGIFFGLFILFPQVGEILTFVGIWLIRYASKKEFRLPFRIPLASNLLDPSDPHPKTEKPTPAKGIGYFGNERKTKKELWFDNSDMRTHILIFGSTGAGKALKNKELIHTPTGWKKNEDLKMGELVSTPYGASPIIGIYPQGKLQLYKVIFEDEREIEVSGDHLWEIHNKSWKKQELAPGVNKNAKVINTKDLIIEFKKNKLNQNYYIILSKEVSKPEQKLNLHPYLIGSLLSKGDIINSNVKFNSSNIEIIENIKKYLPKNTTVSLSNKKEVYDIKSDEKVLLKELINYNLLESKSIIKFIPKEYINSSIEQRYQLICGLMDTNGFAYKEYLEYSTPSKQLAEDFTNVLRSVGAIVNINEKIIDKNYKLNIQHPEPHKLFSVKKDEIKKYKHSEKLKLKVKSVVTLDKKEDCQCIKILDKRGLFITKDYIVTHNTEVLLSLAYNALVQGSGLIYVDGKGENVLYTKIFAMARSMGREDDVLVINYMTGSRDVFGPQEKKLSNTLNPFSSGGSGGLTELLVSLMDDSGGGDMWKGRAISLISAIMMALTYMRDNGEHLLDVDIIREYLILDNIIKLYKTRRDFPTHIRAALRAYLLSIPGFQESTNKQNDTVLEQHGYLQMQFTRLLGALSDSYGFIFKTNLGEVDFKDVVLNRRILVVLLPALEKSTDELANLGKIIVACLKQMMASALGSTIEGTYAEVVETKPTNADMPFMTILDEYGYYAVKGSAVMPAQARSIGFCMIFAGQDLPAFEKASKEEAASIVANCNIKIFMKLEDPDSTYSLFEKSVGEALVSSVGVLEMQQGGLMTTFQAGKSASVEMKKRGNLLDLKDQRAGQGHVIFKSAVIRAQLFYADPPKPKVIRMNYFVRVAPPDISVINQLDNGLKGLLKSLTNINKIKELEENLELDNPHIDKLRNLLNSNSELNMNEAAFASVAALGNEVFDNYEEKIGQYHKALENDMEDEDTEDINIFSPEKNEATIRERYKVVDRAKNKYEKDDDDDEDDDEDEDEDEDDINVFIDEDETRNKFENIERMSGASEIDAKESASRNVDDMKKISKYPSEGMPEKKDASEIMDILFELDQMFDMEEENDNE